MKRLSVWLCKGKLSDYFMTLAHDNINAKKVEIIRLAKNYHAENVRIFGSFVRGEETEESDIDFLVKFSAQASLFDQVGLIDALSQLLQRKVDVVSERAVSPYLQKIINDEAVPL